MGGAGQELRRASWVGCRVMITGAAGFFGSHLAERLTSEGAELVLIDDYSSPAIPAGGPIAGRNVERIDVAHAAFHQLIARVRPDTIFHLAASAYAAGSVECPDMDMRSNLLCTFSFLDALRRRDLHPRFIFASSAAVYGEPQSVPIDDDHRLAPISPYGVSKLAAEQYVSVYSSLYGIRAASLRFFSLYGPRQRKQLVYDSLRKLTSSSPPIWFGDGSQVRDLLYVSDAVDALLCVASRGDLAGETYNVSTGRGASVRETVETIARTIKSDVPVRFNGTSRPGDPEQWVGAAPRIEALGFRPSVALEDGLTRTTEWFLEERLALHAGS